MLTSSALFGSILRQFKRLIFSLRERESNALEEYTLEHFLLYHGLVGTSPENQPEFRNVRADIMEAFSSRSGASLAIALKLPPLWWEEKLQSIFAELKAQDQGLAISLLLPPESSKEIPVGEDPLSLDDWRVRANAALALAFLGAEEAAPRIAFSIEQACRGELKPAFCHLAYALGKLGGEHARQTLIKYLSDEEPWFRVDAARALSLWEFEAVAIDLSRALLMPHNFSDYMAVAIARHHAPSRLLRHEEKLVREAALEMIIQIASYATQTFTSEIVAETGTHLCWSALLEESGKDPSPRLIRATIALSDWLKQLPPQEIDRLFAGKEPAVASANLSLQIETVLQKYSRQALAGKLENELKQFQPGGPADDARHTIWLAGRLKMQSAAPLLIQLIQQRAGELDHVIEALEQLNDSQAAFALVELARQTVDMSERTGSGLSQQPVEESNPSAARTYWLILKALGNLPHPLAAELLIEASQDFAPDKRQQALNSLIAICSSGEIAPETASRLRTIIASGLRDPASMVKIAALAGVSQFQLSDQIPAVIKLLDSKEASINRAAFATITGLAGGDRSKVKDAVAAKLKSEFDHFKKERLEELLQKL